MYRICLTDASSRDRAERLLPKRGMHLPTHVVTEQGSKFVAMCRDISSSGMSLLTWSHPPNTRSGCRVEQLEIQTSDESIPLGSGEIVRMKRSVVDLEGLEVFVIAVRFTRACPDVYERYGKLFTSRRYVIGELEQGYHAKLTPTIDAEEGTLADFHSAPSEDILAKCANFQAWITDMQHKEMYQSVYRVTLTTPIDSRVFGFDPVLRGEREFICFDSNSYLGLHLHPRVVEAAESATRKMGPGTPSAQLLCGTNRYLRELEDAICEFHGREDAMVFPTGFAANAGVLAALVREDDLIVRDRFAHASLHEGCRGTRSRFSRTYPHNDFEELDSIIADAVMHGCQGKLIATDGVFSMHGRMTNLPQLCSVAKRWGARLLVDDAHGTGIIGANGRGIEEAWQIPGSVDVLMGTLSKVLGCLGGYICGSKELIYFLRFFAPAGMFTTTLPSPICAALTEGFRILKEEPQHRIRLWENVNRMWRGLRDVGFVVCAPESAIMTVFMGETRLMLRFSRELFRAGIKCGNVMYPAVARGSAILRLTLSSRHTEEDIDRALAVMEDLGRRYGILGKGEEEIREIGRRLRGTDANDAWCSRANSVNDSMSCKHGTIQKARASSPVQMP